MIIYEQEFTIPLKEGHHELLAYFRKEVETRLDNHLVPVRFVVTATTSSGYRCEVAVVEGLPQSRKVGIDSIFHFIRRRVEHTSAFNAVLVVPTGIGCSIGGHAGDATPVARLLSPLCDTLITHPNVVNASDINEMPENGLYVEGSMISRFLLGAVGLQRVRANRVMAIADNHPDPIFSAEAVNSVSAARATFGLECPRVVLLDPPVRVFSEYAPSGRATGRVEKLAGLVEVLDRYRKDYDAVAISTQIQVPENYHRDYYRLRGEMINPWGGVEAIFTHGLSLLYGLPVAHSPMFESQDVSQLDLGTVDPRMAAEDISIAFFTCVLKGLHHSPRIINDLSLGGPPDILTAADVSCLVIPDKCLGLPTLAALEQGIPVIAVRENRNIMENDLMQLPWAEGQLHMVENYWEVAGVMAALKAGLYPGAVRRPLPDTVVEVKKN